MNTNILVPAARQLVAEVNAAYPGRGTDSDGSVAGGEHSANNPSSDHEPGPAGSPSPGKVDAVDLDDDLIPGDTAASERAMYADVIPSFQAHPGTHYWIYNDQICFRSERWRPRSYAYAGPGRNRHTRHCHLNWQETRAAHNDTSPYGIKGGVGMNLTDKVGNPAYPTRDIRSFFNDLWGVRDALIGDVKGTAAAKIRSTSPVGRLLAVPDMVTALDTYVRKQSAVTLSQADRAAIVAEVSAAIIAAMPEYGPRKNTP